MKTFTSFRKFAAALTFAILGIGSAFAGTAGDTIELKYYYPDSSSLYADYGSATVVGAGADFFVLNTFHVLVTDTQIIVSEFGTSSYFTSSSFNGLHLTDVTKAFSSAFSVDVATNWAGFGAGRVSIAGNTVDIDFNSLSFDNNTKLVLNIAAVPEPETYAMMLAGLGLVGIMVRRRRNQV